MVNGVVVCVWLKQRSGKQNATLADAIVSLTANGEAVFTLSFCNTLLTRVQSRNNQHTQVLRPWVNAMKRETNHVFFLSNLYFACTNTGGIFLICELTALPVSVSYTLRTTSICIKLILHHFIFDFFFVHYVPKYVHNSHRHTIYKHKFERIEHIDILLCVLLFSCLTFLATWP